MAKYFEVVNCFDCGKPTPSASFHPEELDDDIIVVEMRGLGRGRGFEKTGVRSGLNDREIYLPFVRRSLRLLRILLDRGRISEEFVLRYLFPGDEDGSLVADLVSGIEKVLGEDSDEWISEEEEESDILTKLGIGVKRLKESLLAARAEVSEISKDRLDNDIEYEDGPRGFDNVKELVWGIYEYNVEERKRNEQLVKDLYWPKSNRRKLRNG